MRIFPILIMTLASGLNAKNLPENFYMEETYKEFVREEAGDVYYIEKKVNNNLTAVLEEYTKNNKILGKYEAVFINPVDGNFSYNNFYQINKNYSYKNGKIYSVNYEIGKMETCFVKCGDEIYYTEGKVVKKNKYPACLSLFDIEKRVLKFSVKYVKDNCS